MSSGDRCDLDSRSQFSEERNGSAQLGLVSIPDLIFKGQGCIR